MKALQKSTLLPEAVENPFGLLAVIPVKAGITLCLVYRGQSFTASPAKRGVQEKSVFKDMPFNKKGQLGLPFFVPLFFILVCVGSPS